MFGKIDIRFGLGDLNNIRFMEPVVNALSNLSLVNRVFTLF
jgi:hypothetical protein